MNTKLNKYLIWFPKKLIFLKLFNLFKFFISKKINTKILNLPITWILNQLQAVTDAQC